MSRLPISTNRPPKASSSRPALLGRTGDRVEHDVDAVPVGVAADLFGEVGAARVVDMLDSHVAQQLSALLAAGGGEDLRTGGARDGDRGLAHTAGGGVDQHLVTSLDAGLIVEAVPGGGGARWSARRPARRSGRPAA